MAPHTQNGDGGEDTNGMDDPGSQKIWNVILSVLAALILLGITVVGSLLWQGNTSIVRLQAEQAAFGVQMSSMQLQITSLIGDRYTKHDADKDQASTQKVTDALANSLQKTADTLTLSIQKATDLLTLRVEQIEMRQRDELVRLGTLESRMGLTAVKPPAN